MVDKSAATRITSSARASSVGGTMRPSARAVLRFTANWKFGGLHYRQVRSKSPALRICAAYRRRLAIGVRQVGAVTHEAAGKEHIRAKRNSAATPCRVASATILSRWLSTGRRQQVGGNNKHINAVLYGR